MEKKTKVTKKNTLLYLDENLVEKAKEMNFNISELAEEAIRTKLNIKGYNKSFDPSEYLENLRKKGLAYRIPFKISKVKIKNSQQFRELEIDFQRKNILTGVNAPGKTTILRSILLFFDNSYSLQNFSYNESPERSSEVEIRFDHIDKLSCEVYGERIDLNEGSILIDRGIENLDHNSSVDFLKYLLERNEQIIATSLSYDRYNSEPWMKKYNTVQVNEDPAEQLRKMLMKLEKELLQKTENLKRLQSVRAEVLDELNKSQKRNLKEQEAKTIEARGVTLDNQIEDNMAEIEVICMKIEEIRSKIQSYYGVD